jgi:integrase/recombinase XerD
VIKCPLDEMNRPRTWVDPQLRAPPAEEEIEQLFAGWRGELATCRKFAPAARNYAAARLEADVGLRVNEACMLDLDDVRWELGRSSAATSSVVATAASRAAPNEHSAARGWR